MLTYIKQPSSSALLMLPKILGQKIDKELRKKLMSHLIPTYEEYLDGSVG